MTNTGCLIEGAAQIDLHSLCISLYDIQRGGELNGKRKVCLLPPGFDDWLPFCHCNLHRLEPITPHK